MIHIFRVKNWGKFQSYKDRNPLWIRFHKRILDNYDYQTMSSDARALLPMMWLLASEDDDPVSGLIRIGYERIAFRLRLDIDVVVNAIDECIKRDFLECIKENISGTNNDRKREFEDSVTEVIQTPCISVTSETETETENTLCDENTFPKRKRRKPRSKIDYTPEFSEFWNVYPRPVCKQVAFDSWGRLLKDGFPAKDIIRAAMEYADAREGKEEEFTLHPATFLNKGRWKDYCFKEEPSGT